MSTTRTAAAVLLLLGAAGASSFAVPRESSGERASVQSGEVLFLKHDPPFPLPAGERIKVRGPFQATEYHSNAARSFHPQFNPSPRPFPRGGGDDVSVVRLASNAEEGRSPLALQDSRTPEPRELRDSGSRAYPDPARFEDEVGEFEEADHLQAPPKNAIVCIGSSSVRGWHEDIDEDLTPLTIIARGFGGSNMNEALYYADRIVIPYAPRAVVLYEGDNDIAQGVSPETVCATFRGFVDRVRVALPETRFYVLSIKPSIDRWKLWPRMKDANRLLAEVCASDAKLTYVDVATGMLDAEDEPRPEIFLEDDLHMNRAGYEIWRDALRPILLGAELPFEAVHQTAADE